LLRCEGGKIQSSDGQWSVAPLRRTESKFQSHGQQLAGVLIEPSNPGPHPLVIFVHGSERSSPRLGSYPYLFAAQGLSVFAYDKRGTGDSEGEYTQNFELLADDAAAAMKEARRLAAGRFDRAGYFGGSQGGWIAPLAATRSPADFVAVGFGLMASPLEEDRSQVQTEMRAKGYGPAEQAEAAKVADAAGALVASHFTVGFDRLAEVRSLYGSRKWFGEIKGEFTGEIIRSSEADLRRVGRALYDNLELIWDYDAVTAIRRVKAPQLWIVAESDREAPSEETLRRLKELRDGGAELAIYTFPDTDHGMVEFTQAADGSRKITRITDGYFRLLTDWIRGRVEGSYGRARKQ
jgi:pimeloyl-ACP methyl ester carboxylesterase